MEAEELESGIYWSLTVSPARVIVAYLSVNSKFAYILVLVAKRGSVRPT